MSAMAVHYSSEKQDWETPRAFFDKLNAEFGFTLDAAASADNALCARYFTAADNALLQPWEGVVWCNPPYGRVQADFIRHGAKQAALRGSTVVFLIPARPDTKVWQEIILPRAEIRFVSGRLKFSGHKNAAPFPSAVVIFRG